MDFILPKSRRKVMGSYPDSNTPLPSSLTGPPPFSHFPMRERRAIPGLAAASYKESEMRLPWKEKQIGDRDALRLNQVFRSTVPQTPYAADSGSCIKRRTQKNRSYRSRNGRREFVRELSDLLLTTA